MTGVPFEDFVIRTARLRPVVAGAAIETRPDADVTRTARVRDGVAVSVVVPTVLLLVMPATPKLLAVTVLGVAADVVTDVVVAAALFPTMVPERFDATVGDGTTDADAVGVGAPTLTWVGVAAAAAVVAFVVTRPPVVAMALVTGAAVIALVTAPVVAPVVAPVAAPLTIVTPAPLSLMTTGVGSELIEELTVISGLAMPEAWTCSVCGTVALTSACPGDDGPRMRPRKPCCPATIAYASTAGVVMLAGPAEIMPFAGTMLTDEFVGIETGCGLSGIVLAVQPKTASAAASVVLASKCLLLTTLRIGASFMLRQDSERYLEQERGHSGVVSA
jgi:hypothetical protein